MSGAGGQAEHQRFQRVEELFLAALERPREERAAYLREACAGDDALRREVEAMLTADATADGLLEASVQGHAAAVSAEVLAAEVASGEAVSGRIGERLGNYRLVAELGRGGMSVVYLAARSDDEYEQKVAIKLIAPSFLGEELRVRLLAERQILARLQHPNIARLLDGGTTADGTPYFVMEHVEGVRIDQYCEEQGLPVARRLRLFRKVCAAVHFAHRRLVVHRDLKPSNVLVDAEGEPRLLDFGIAKLLEEGAPAPGAEPTRTLLRMGTPGFASPEQLAGEPVTTASDVYSLGVLLGRLLAGERSPGGADELPADLRLIVAMCQRDEPERRYGSVEQLSEDLERYLTGHPVIARRDTFGYRAAKFVRRNRWGTLFAATLATLLIGSALAMAVQKARTERQRDRAERVAGMLAELFEIAGPSAERGGSITARELLDQGRAQLARLDDQAADQAMLRDTLGGLYEQLGMYAEARELFGQAFEQRRALYGERNLEVADSLYHYARATARNEDFAAAERLFRQALELRRALLGENHLDVLTSMNSLALVLHERGDYQQAAPLYREAIAKTVRLVGGRHPQTVKTRYNLALLLHDIGEYGEAEELFREILVVSEAADDPGHLAEVRDLLGQTLLAAGKLEEAEQALSASYQTRRHLLGDEHPLVGRSANHLGDLYRERGELAAAEALIEEALSVRRRLLGEESAEVAESLASLGSLRAAQGRLEEAETLYAGAASIYGQSFSSEHPFVGRVLADWGLAVAASGRCARAEPLLSEALALLPRTDRRVAPAMAAVAECRSTSAPGD